MPYFREHYGIVSRGFFWTLVFVMTGLVTFIGSRLIRRNQGLIGAVAPKRPVP